MKDTYTSFNFLVEERHPYKQLLLVKALNILKTMDQRRVQYSQGVTASCMAIIVLMRLMEIVYAIHLDQCWRNEIQRSNSKAEKDLMDKWLN